MELLPLLPSNLEVVLELIVRAGSILITDMAPTFLAQCTPNTCPGSFYNMVTTAWANIGYATHSDFIKLVTETKFGAWAPLLYAVAAIGALINVALNNPPRNYAWFFVGPALFYFLVTPSPNDNIYGVSWRVAGEDLKMQDVWKNAEVGLVNTRWADGIWSQYSKETGHGSNIKVGQGLLFLDELFSATTDLLIRYIGISRARGQGGGQSNLAAFGGDEGPWYLMANEKWGMLENIVGVTARDPDVRDALVTFLSSECGDQFKKGIDDGRYIAAATSRGKSLPLSVMRGGPEGEFKGTVSSGAPAAEYEDFQHGLDGEYIPTPRSLIRLFDQPNSQGSFTQFNAVLQNNKAEETGRTVEIMCSEFLWTMIQALRWESGHAYWQLLRAAPGGMTSQEVLKTLFYGWDVRKSPGSNIADFPEMESFVKQLILLYMVRNELMFAPEITETTQRFAPSEQTRQYTEAYVRDQGSKAKAGELYNWAVLMPYVQGILAYLILIGYPFAAMMMVIPGQWKAFYTWMTFFAWIKLWDVGFAIVHSLERSVWAMIGNRSSMATVANVLLQTADGFEIDVGCGGAGGGAGEAADLCAVPSVKSNFSLDGPGGQSRTWMLLDRLLLSMGAADLDLSNGYYIYIMAALYFAVPAVTGQLVLGAKAGMASLATQAIGQNAQEAGGAAKSAVAGEANQRIGQVGAAIGQAALAKAYRKGGQKSLAMEAIGAENMSLKEGLGAATKRMKGQGLEANARVAGILSSNYDSAERKTADRVMAAGEAVTDTPNAGSSGGGGGGGRGKGFLGYATSASAKGQQTAMGFYGHGLQTKADQASVDAAGASQRLGINAMAGDQRAQGLNNYAQRVGAGASFDAESAAWEAKNAWGNSVAGMAGVYGANPGSLVGHKPSDMRGMLFSGQAVASSDKRGAGRLRFGMEGGRFQTMVGNRQAGLQRSVGSSFVTQPWTSTSDGDGFGFVDSMTAPYGAAAGKLWGDTKFEQGQGEAIANAAKAQSEMYAGKDKLPEGSGE